VGPAPRQVSFALGVVQKGVAGGLMTGVLFQYPGFLIAALVGAGAANVLKHPAPWLHGLTSGAGPGCRLLAEPPRVRGAGSQASRDTASDTPHASG